MNFYRRQVVFGILLVLAVSLWSSGLFADEIPGEKPVSFQNDVMAVLSKAGCNMGICHGNKFGKGGLKISLRGDDPAGDYETLTRTLSGRRANPLDPDRSLLLLKPTMQVAHEGGKRFQVDSPEYRILRSWIAAGLPRDVGQVPRVVRLDVTPLKKVLIDPEQKIVLHAEAVFSDGTRRDVTRLAVYESANQLADVTPEGVVERVGFGEDTVSVRYLNQQVPVRLAFVPNRPGYVWKGPEPANNIDKHVFAKLQSLRMNPSAVVNDAVFMRRAYLDLLGILPTEAEARKFVVDFSIDKRSKLIDALLERPEYADFWSLKWSDLLRVEEKTLDRKGVQAFHSWIRFGIARNKPLDQLARELIASRGSTYKHPESNYYRAMREPLMRAETTAQMFLGVRLQCAKCHNHPFDRWTQDDYYGWANLFSRVEYKILENRRRDRNDKHEFDGEQIVYMVDNGEVENPRIGKPTPPRFLGDRDQPVDESLDRLQQLAAWVGNSGNRRFAQTQVNRIWHHLMGRGIVDPIDDFRATNPPVNPELLDALAEEFVTHKFDLKHMIRLIMNSKTYQLSSEPNETNRDDATNFSHASVRRLSAEQMLDSLAQVTGVPVVFNGYPVGVRAGEIPGVQAIRLRDQSPSQADQFLKLFGKPARLQPCECERTDETTLAQTFQLVSGRLVNNLLMRDSNRLTKLLASNKSSREIVESFYWTALTRSPGSDELAATVRYLETAAERRRALEDITWALLNSHEFMLRR